MVGITIWGVGGISEPAAGGNGDGRVTRNGTEAVPYSWEVGSRLPKAVFDNSGRRQWRRLEAPGRVRGIEPVRIVRELLPDGRLVLAGGRTLSLLGCRHTTSPTKKAGESWKQWSGEIAGKQVRLVFEEETRNASGELTAYVHRLDGPLLNEVFLAEGMLELDKAASLSPKYHRRLRKAKQRSFWTAVRQKRKSRGNDAAHPFNRSQLPEHRGGFSGFSPRKPGPGGRERSGEDQSP